MVSICNRLIQVKVSGFAYEYIRKYSEIFHSSISKFCECAINEKILSLGGVQCTEEEDVVAHQDAECDVEDG